jgi:lipoprotein-anchoring transpeptidase ErfK/SrfK
MNVWPLRPPIMGALVAAFAALFAPPALAQQLFWDWGGGDAVGASGSEIVRFSERFAPGQIVVSFGDRRLYFVTRPGEAISYPIAIPRDEDRWEGVTSVTNKRVNPSWTPTATMTAENPRLPRWVPGGHPMNPLGVRALYLGESAYRIHGTDAPWTIGTAVSKGCIRMYNQDVLDLYPRVSLGAQVAVTWERFQSGGSYASTPRAAGPRLREMRQSDLPRSF